MPIVNCPKHGLQRSPDNDCPICKQEEVIFVPEEPIEELVVEEVIDELALYRAQLLGR